MNSIQASFRDPGGQVFLSSDRVFRVIRNEGAECWQFYKDSPRLSGYRASGSLIDYEPAVEETVKSFVGESGNAVSADDLHAVAQHPLISFPNYPGEWSPAMLKAAAELTIDLAEAALGDNGLLKDATPFNVVFDGPMPVFVDALSFEPSSMTSPIWLPEAQFLRTFVFPLVLWSKQKMPPSLTLSGQREGISTDQVLPILGPMEKLLPRYLFSVTLPAWFDRKSRAEWTEKGVATARKFERPPEQSVEVLRRLFQRLRRLLDASFVASSTSHWSQYDQRKHYSEAATAKKKEFVETVLASDGFPRLIDVGCNLGEFTRIAAKHRSVVAIDNDPEVVDEVYRTAQAESLDILPLVLDVASPTPGFGWKNNETQPFASRGRQKFDCVMMLAVIHHLIVSSRIPLDDIVDMLDDLSKDAVIVEYVGPDDPMFKAIARGRESLHSNWSSRAFETSLSRRFEIQRKEHVPGIDRILYFGRKTKAG